MNILVIGNGFDLAHGLPTQYGNFLDYLKKYHEYEQNKLADNPSSLDEEELLTHFLKLENEKPHVFREIQKLTKDNTWIKYFTNVYENRRQEGKVGWIDFENEISTIIQALDAARITLNSQFRNGSPHGKLEQWQLNALDPILSQDGKVRNCAMCYFDNTYIFNCKAVLYDDMVRLIRSLEIYLSSYISYEASNDLILFIEQNNKRIEELCARKWPYIEKEDREQVAKMKLAEVFPRLRLDDGHFWQDYELLLDRHMRERKEEMTSLFRFRCRSLDAPMRTKIPGQTCTLFDFLSDDGI